MNAAPPSAKGRLRLSKRHFNALDFSRLLAAVAVLFWHYQHFFVPPVEYGFHVRRSAVVPLYHALAWLYDYGHTAVQYFWAVSGFVFAHVYLADTQGRGRFWLARVARLWPLHLLTLMLVAVLQAAYAGLNGTDFIYHQNNLKHFLLSLPLMQYWGWQDNQSFNGPSWSLSTEMLAYAVFWLTLPALRRAPLALGLPIAAGFVWAVFAKLPDRDVMACIGYFFGGVAVYGMALRGWLRPATLLPLGALLVAGAFWTWNGWQSRDMVILAGTFAALCLTLALDLADRNDRFAIGRQLGDASYGIYLWHFPLQLMLVLLIDETVGTRRIASQPAFLVFFLGLAILAGFASHRWFERPAQRWVFRMAKRLRDHHPAHA
ncbi:acyltransferase [Novosphingobium sp. LASN5T]|uniref:acyltransferase family protein n=1 Tax=Novosphingobium sp. LASN5T TaxID=2491021 RepID=UPI000F5DB786|nr:acyltransferase [Novosphingobium sp. LASN5T]RQW42938.1 acyltransferase [Novosphingobium sp. LASN5T]